MLYATEIQKIIFDMILQERERQERLHGEHNAKLTPLDAGYFPIVNEEWGEANQAWMYLTNQDEIKPELLDHYIAELIETSSCVVQMLERALKLKMELKQ